MRASVGRIKRSEAILHHAKNFGAKIWDMGYGIWDDGALSKMFHWTGIVTVLLNSLPISQSKVKKGC